MCKINQRNARVGGEVYVVNGDASIEIHVLKSIAVTGDRMEVTTLAVYSNDPTNMYSFTSFTTEATSLFTNRQSATLESETILRTLRTDRLHK